ncbi:MAG: DNA polymerase I [Candidatus Omnitrophica bacterium]|nr:DNA polymerase I [Candidatus Omnitrophota bacterium]
MEKERLFILDGNSFCYRAYYAIKGLSTSKGMPTNAIYGFVNMLNKIIREEKPQYLAVAFDMKGPTFRHKLFEDYKIKRPPMPNDLVEQLVIIKDIVQAYNIPIFEKEGYEADDIIATIVNKLKNNPLLIFIVTADKDVLQLVENGICVYNPYSKDNPIYDLKYVHEKFGIMPQFIPDFLALTGDDTDNIPGIKGIGEKTARQLLDKFHSLDNLLSQSNKIANDILRKTIETERERIVLNRKLALLNRDVPLEFNFEEMRVSSPDKNRLLCIFKELEFKNLLKELIKDEVHKPEAEILEITDRKGWNSYLNIIREKGKFSFILDMEEHSVLGGVYVYYGEKILFINLDKKNSELTIEDISCIFSDASLVKICHDLKRIKPSLEGNGILIKGYVFDIMLASYLLNPSASDYTVENIALDYLNVLPPLASQKFSEGIYSKETTKIIFALFGILEQQLKEKQLLDLYLNLELPLVDVLCSMENKGVFIDLNFLQNLSQDLRKRIEEIKREIFHIADEEFNLDSHLQLRKILFEKLKLPVIKRVKTGPSTDEEVLVKLSDTHRLPQLILEYREVAKLKSTYVDGFFASINPKTGRIHSNFSQINTETGRLSSSNPNLQNIPIKTDFGRQIRRAITVPDKEYLLLSADYSQIELRILAHLSGDKTLVDAFNNGVDIHTHTASTIFSLPMDKITSQMRSFAKTINFGILYGMSPFGLAKELNIDLKESERFIEAYFMRYAGVKSYIEEKIKEARDKGYVTTMLNRRRYIPYINSPNQTLRQLSERIAINTPVQGSAADIIKLAMYRIYKEISNRGLEASIILQIHDELLFEFHQRFIVDLLEIVRKEMENVIKLNIPLKVSMKTGHNWLEMQELNIH